MASIEKARRFLDESDSHTHYSSIVEYVLTYFITKARLQGNDRFAADLEKAKAEYHDEFRWAHELAEEVHAELFTDEELDDLIVLHSNPALKKARALTADIFSAVLEKYRAMSA
jgi:preprotein translocase subunit SecA